MKNKSTGNRTKRNEESKSKSDLKENLFVKNYYKNRHKKLSL